MTRERYQEKECARIALAKALMIPYTADLSKQPEADLLTLGPATYQAVLAREVEGDVIFDPFKSVADYTVFLVKDGEREFRFLGYLSKNEAEAVPFWLLGRVSLEELNPTLTVRSPA